MSQEIRKEIRKAFFQGRLRVRSVTASGEVVEAVVSDVMKHSTGHKPAFRVEVEDGAYVVVTGDHSLFSKVNGEYVPVRADRITTGSHITVVSQGEPQEAKVVKIEEVDPLGESYDLSVPGPENFILTNGILAHNSYSIGGVSLDLEKSSKYESAYQNYSDQFERQLERAKQTVKVVRGLQQPRFGMGMRSSFGPHVGSGVLTPRKFVGF